MRGLGVAMVLLFGLPGCGPILKVAYGIRRPRPLEPEVLEAYLARKGLPTTDLAKVRADQYAEAWTGGRVPDLRIFDREGRLVPYGPPGSCNAPAFDFLETLARDGTYETAAAPSRDEALAALEALRGEPLPADLADADLGADGGRQSERHRPVREGEPRAARRRRALRRPVGQTERPPSTSMQRPVK